MTKSFVLKAIRLKRIEKEYSQEYISIELNMSQANYGRIENGKTTLSITLLLDILKILKIDYMDFFFFVKEMEIKDKM